MTQLRAKDIMSTQVITLDQDMLLTEAAEFLVKQMISGAPVVDENGDMKGVLSILDIARSSARNERGIFTGKRQTPEYFVHDWELPLSPSEVNGFYLEIDNGLRVRDVMTPQVFSVDEDTTVQEMANFMLTGRIHRLIVTRKGDLVGIVTTSDMMKVVRDHT